MTKTIDELAVDFEISVRKARDASYYWRVNKQQHGPTHWITQGLWESLQNAWRASDRAWWAYQEAYHAQQVDQSREVAQSKLRHPSAGVRP